MVVSCARSVETGVGVKNSPPFLPAFDWKSPIRYMYAVPSTSPASDADAKGVSWIFRITLEMRSVRSDTSLPRSESRRSMASNRLENATSDFLPIVEPVSCVTALSNVSMVNVLFLICSTSESKSMSGSMTYPRFSRAQSRTSLANSGSMSGDESASR